MSFKPYPKYKDSGVEWLGKVPEHWEVGPPKRFVRSAAGGTLIKGQCANEPSAELFPAYSASGQDVWVEEFAYDCDGLVLSAVGARCGKTFRANGRWGVVANTHCLFPRENAHCHFLWYLTNQESWWEKGGSAQPFVRVSETLSRVWAFPSYPEQSSIASFLDHETSKIDSLIKEQEKLIELLKEKRSAVISHAVTKGLDENVKMKDSGVEWLGEVPEYWRVRRIASVSTKITNGYVGPTRDILTESGVRYLQSLHIKNNKICFENPYYVSEDWSLAHSKSILCFGDVLIVQTGDIGQATSVGTDFVGCNCHALIVVSPIHSIVRGDWIAWSLNASYGKNALLSIQTGALHPHLNCGDIKDVSLPIPPIGEQARILKFIAEECEKLDSLVNESESAINLLQERRSALISAAVTGQIDVRDFVPSKAA